MAQNVGNLGPRDWFDRYTGLGFGLGRRRRRPGFSFQVQPPVGRKMLAMEQNRGMSPEPMFPTPGSTFGVHRGPKNIMPSEFIDAPYQPIGTNWGMPIYPGQHATGEYMGGGTRGWYTPPPGMTADAYYGGAAVPMTHRIRNPEYVRPPLNPRAIVGRSTTGRNIYAGRG